jgi:drug/metabolite transporter (DMT)-like permease
VLLFSLSPVLTRWALAGVGPWEAAFWRLLVAGLAVQLAARIRRQPLPQGREISKFALFGLVAALHFLTYIASLQYTTIVHSLALVYTAPVFVALFGRLTGVECISRRQWLGIGVVVVGVAVLTGFATARGNGGMDRRMVFGDLLALCSAITFAIYSLAGRSQRSRYGLFAYAGTVYTLAALWALPVAWLTRSVGGYTIPVVASLLALALLPLAVGHTLYNGALRRTSATVVNVLATQELTLGVLWGALLLGEMPTGDALAGAGLTFLGILLVVL